MIHYLVVAGAVVSVIVAGFSVYWLLGNKENKLSVMLDVLITSVRRYKIYGITSALLNKYTITLVVVDIIIVMYLYQVVQLIIANI